MLKNKGFISDIITTLNRFLRLFGNFSYIFYFKSKINSELIIINVLTKEKQ